MAVNCCVVPGAIEAFAGVTAIDTSTGSTPVPVRETFCGLFVALSATESVAVMAPAAAGVKVTLMVHEA